MLDLVNHNMMMHGGTMPSMTSSTVQDADDEIDETAPMTKPGKLATRFKRRARPPSHKDPEENNYRVSIISNNEYVVSTCSSYRFVNTQIN